MSVSTSQSRRYPLNFIALSRVVMLLIFSDPLKIPLCEPEIHFIIMEICASSDSFLNRFGSDHCSGLRTTLFLVCVLGSATDCVVLLNVSTVPELVTRRIDCAN